MRRSSLKTSASGPNRAQQRKVLNEKRRRQAVRRIINEELLMIEQHKRIGSLIIREEKRMLAEGYHRSEINEGIMSFLGKLPGSYMTYLKQYFIGILLDKLGMDTESIVGYALKNVLENMEFTNITKYFGTGGCKPLVDLILESVAEAISEKGLDKISEMLFGRKIEGFISGTGREMLMNTLRDMTDNLREPISEYVCNLDFSTLISGLTGLFNKSPAPGAPSPIPATP